jgi:hypothetical protein
MSMRRRHPGVVPVVLGLWVGFAVGSSSCAVTLPEAAGSGAETWQVWRCRVPAGTSGAEYAGAVLGDERVEIDVGRLSDALRFEVAPWFAAVSDGAAELDFVPGGSVELDGADGAEACLRRALDASAAVEPAADAVIAVADAVHADDVRGGIGRPATPCAADCRAVTTRRGVAVGAADFVEGYENVRWDLVEHEIGHSFGWRHSGVDADGDYTSGIDVMSDAALLGRLDPDIRHAPPPLAVHRSMSGWIAPDEVRRVRRSDVDNGAVSVELVGRRAESGVRLLRLVVDNTAHIAVELLDDELLGPIGPGVAVHRVTDATIVPVIGDPTHSSLLAPGSVWSGDGWRLVVTDEWTVRVSR